MEPMLAMLQWATTLVAQTMMAWLGTPMSWHGDQLSHAGGFVAQLHADCTAWWPAWCAVFAVAAWGAWVGLPVRRTMVGALAGLLAMVLVNQARLVAVLWAGVHAPAAFDLAHEVLGPLLLVATGAAVVAVTVRGHGRMGRREAEPRSVLALEAPRATAT